MNPIITPEVHLWNVAIDSMSKGGRCWLRAVMTAITQSFTILHVSVRASRQCSAQRTHVAACCIIYDKPTQSKIFINHLHTRWHGYLPLWHKRLKSNPVQNLHIVISSPSLARGQSRLSTSALRRHPVKGGVAFFFYTRKTQPLLTQGKDIQRPLNNTIRHFHFEG